MPSLTGHVENGRDGRRRRRSNLRRPSRPSSERPIHSDAELRERPRPCSGAQPRPPRGTGNALWRLASLTCSNRDRGTLVAAKTRAAQVRAPGRWPLGQLAPRRASTRSMRPANPHEDQEVRRGRNTSVRAAASARQKPCSAIRDAVGELADEDLQPSKAYWKTQPRAALPKTESPEHEQKK